MTFRSRHQILFYIVLSAGACRAVRANQQCVGIHGYPEQPVSSATAATVFNVSSKARYFGEYLPSLGISSSHFQDVDSPGSLCLKTRGDAELFPAKCISDRGIRWAVFIGDSLSRGLGLSFARHGAVGDVAGTCSPRPVARWDGDFLDARNHPSFRCSSQSAPGGPLCPPSDQQPFKFPSTDYECCSAGFWLYYLDQPQPWGRCAAWHSLNRLI